MAEQTLESLFVRYSGDGDIEALAEVFDRVAPDLQRLARRLCGDRNRAEDLVQATFLAALERPGTFEAGRALRPWLLGILVNRASVDRRKAERTPEFDRLEKREVETPLAATSASETRAVVERAIADLPPKLRRVVEAKLIEETDTATLAEELAISRGALRVRLHRGLETLRRALPPSLATVFAATFIHSRGLAQVRSHVLQAAARQASGSAVAAASAGAIGMGALMSKELLGGVAAALLIVLATVIYQLEPPAVEATDEVARPDVELAAAPVERVDATPVSSRVEVPSTVDPAPVGVGTVAALVTHADGTPAVDFEVVVRHADLDGVTATNGRTDAEGLASIELPAGLRLNSVEVPSTPTTTPDKQWTQRRLSDGERVEVALQVTDGWPVSGTVIDGEGRPVPGAVVEAWCQSDTDGQPDRTTRTTADGRFRIEHLGPQFVALAHADGLVCAEGLRGELREGVLAEGLTIRLTRAKRMHGVVFDPNHNPVSGVELWISHGLDPMPWFDVSTFRASAGHATSDAQGRFEIDGLSRDRHKISAKLVPYLVYGQTRDTGDDPVIIVLDAGLGLRGRVLDAEGKPATGARVHFWPRYSNVQTVPSPVRCDERGEFHLVGMLPGELHRNGERNHAIAIVHAGHAVHAVQPVEPSADGGRFVDIRLESERVISGRVLDYDRQPVTGVTVRIEGDREIVDATNMVGFRSTWEYCTGLSETETDEEGAFRFDRLYPGEFRVRALSPLDPLVNVETTVRSGVEDLELVLDPALMRKVVLKGTVRDRLTGEPVPKFKVTPYTGNFGYIREFDDPTGEYEVVGLPAGLIRVSISAEGYARHELPESEFAFGEHRIDVMLAPERTLEIKVVDETGEIYPYGDLRVLDRLGAELSIGTEKQWSNSERLRDGTAVLPGLPAELVTLEVSVGAQQESNVHEFPIDLTHPLESPLELVVPRKPEEQLTSVKLVALVIADDLDPGEVRKRLPGALAQNAEDVAWMQAAVQAGRISPDVQDVIELRLEHDDRQFATAKITPQAEGGYLIETDSSSASWGGVSHGSSGANVHPQPIVFISFVPRAEIRMEVTSTRYRRIDRLIDCSGDARAEEFLLLQEL